MFKEFELVSEKNWKQQIQFDLDGKDYNKEVNWVSNEGINVKPFFTEKYKSLKIANTISGSNNSTKDTKLEINSLIREIDYCISQLTE